MPLLNYNLCSRTFVSRSRFLKCVHLIHLIDILLMASYTNHVRLAPKNHLNVGPDLSAQLQIWILHSPMDIHISDTFRQLRFTYSEPIISIFFQPPQTCFSSFPYTSREVRQNNG